MSLRKLPVFVLMFLMIETTKPVAAQIDTASITSGLNSLKDKLGKQYVFMLYANDKPVYKKEAGEFTVKTPVPVSAASQWITAALVMTYVQEGKISFNDKVSDFLPIFARHGKGYITLGHCLTFNTGIEAAEGIGKLFKKSKYKTLEDEVNDYAAKMEIGTNPGTEFRYSNIGFNIAARMLEVITKKPYDRMVQERIFRPLNMRNASFANENYNDAVSAADGAKTSAADYLNFLAMLLNNGTFNNKQVLTPESIITMFKRLEIGPNIKNTPKGLEHMDYGSGVWMLENETDGPATVYTSPSLTGIWPVLDRCHQYAFILLTKPQSGEAKREVITRIKEMIDDMMPASCQ